MSVIYIFLYSSFVSIFRSQKFSHDGVKRVFFGKFARNFVYSNVGWCSHKSSSSGFSGEGIVYRSPENSYAVSAPWISILIKV